MTLTTRTPLRQCGRRWTSLHAAEHSKLYLNASGALEAWEHPACAGVHLRPAGSGAKAAATLTQHGTGPDRATRLLVYERDGHACVCCGTPVKGRPHSVGHRKRRSQGGKHTPPNLLTFLGLGRNPLDPDDHHARIDSRKNPHDEARGYTVRRNGDPAQVPVMYFDLSGGGFTAWLCADGSLSFDGPEVAA